MPARTRFLPICLALAFAACGCAGEPNPFTVTVENASAEPLWVVGLETPEPDVYVEWGGEWRITGVGDCYRPCGKPNMGICPTLAPRDDAYLLMPGDAASYPHSGEAFQPTSDGFPGECSASRPVEGPVRVEVCFGTDAWSTREAQWEPPAVSGGLEDVEFERLGCAAAELVVPDQAAVTVALEWP